MGAIGQQDTKVGVFDSGIYWPHEDFGDSASAGSKIPFAWDYRQDLSAFTQEEPDGTGHGTQVAGIIGALRNNNKGVAGVAGGDMQNGNHGCKLYAYTIYLHPQPSPPTPPSVANLILHSVVSEAIVEGASQTENDYGHGLHIQNHSWGTTFNSATLKDAVEFCYLNNCAFVVSSGNVVHPDTIYYPASYNDDWVVRVGACFANSEWADFSTFYHNTVDIIAGGGDVGQVETTETHPGNHYISVIGTSVAAPHASGVIALMEAEHRPSNGYPNRLAPEDYEYFLQQFAKDIDSVGYDQRTGHGIIDAGKSLKRLSLPAYYVKHSGVGGSPVQTVTANLFVTVTNNFAGITAGSYIADRYTISNSFTDVFPPNETVIDEWPRYSSSNGVSASGVINGQTNFNYTISTSLNTTTVSTTTYCWHITENADGDPMDAWIPAPPNEIKTAYSLYVMNSDYVGLEENQTNEFNLYPNPANSSLTLQFTLPVSSDISYTIIDASGRTIQGDTKSIIQTGTQNFNIDISHVSKGLYICTLNTGENIFTKRFIKN